MSRKTKLIERILALPRDFTWDEGCALMKACGFQLVNRRGSMRMFVHLETRLKVGVHEPHPEKTLKRYALEALIDGLRIVGEVQ